MTTPVRDMRAASSGSRSAAVVVWLLAAGIVLELLVYIHPNKHDTLLHDLPPLRVALCGGPIPPPNPRCARGRSFHQVQPL
jgi:hypothetical protein